MKNFEISFLTANFRYFFTGSCSLDCGKFKLIISCFTCDNRTTPPINCYCEDSYGFMNLFFYQSLVGIEIVAVCHCISRPKTIRTLFVLAF